MRPMLRAGLTLSAALALGACLDDLSVGLSASAVRTDAGMSAGTSADAAALDAALEPGAHDGGELDGERARSDASAGDADAAGAVDASPADASPGEDGSAAQVCAVSFCAIVGFTHDDGSRCDDGSMASCLRDRQTGLCGWHCP